MPRVWLAWCVVGSTLACAHAAPPPRLVLDVTNELGRAISEIRQKSCGDLDLAFVIVPDSRIAAGQTRGIELPRTCVDIVAFDARGRVVGEQRALKMLPGASWVLRR